MRTVFDVIARDGASGPLGRVSASMRGLGSAARQSKAALAASAAAERQRAKDQKNAMQMVAVGAGMMRAGGGVIAGLREAEKQAGEFEYRMAAVGALSKATADDLRLMGRAAIEAGIATQYTPQEAADALQTLSQAGFNARQSIDALMPSLDLAAGSAGQLTIADSANVITQAIKGYGVAMKDATLTADQLLAASQMFSIEAEDLPLGLGNVARGAQTMNQSLQESLVTFGFVRNVVKRVATASAAAGIGMERMADPKVQKKLHAIGVEVTDSQHRFRQYLDVVSDLVPKLNEMTEQKRGAFLLETFDAEGSRAINAIMGQLNNGIQTHTGETLKGRNAIAYYRQEIAGASGTAKDFREALLSTAEGQKLLLKGSQDTLRITFGGALSAMIKPFMKAHIGTINTLIRTFDALPPVAQQLAVGFTGVGAAFVKVTGATMLMLGAMKLLNIRFGGLVLMFGKTMLVAAPLLAVVGALGVGFYGLHRSAQKNVGGLGDVFSGMWGKVKLAWQGTVELISGAGFSEATKKALQDGKNQGVGKFLVWMTGAIGRAKAFFSGLVAGFDVGLERLGGPIDRFKGALMGIFGLTAESDPAKKLTQWSTAGFKFGEKLSEMTGKVLELGTRGILWLQEKLDGFSADSFVGILDTVASAAESTFSVVGRIVDDLIWMYTTVTNITHVFDKVQGASAQQMTDWATIAGGAEGGRMLREEFRNIETRAKLGVLPGGSSREAVQAAKETAYVKYEKMMGSPESDRASDIWAEGVKAMTGELNKLNRNLERTKDSATKGLVLKVGEERFAELVRGVEEKQKEAGYEEEGASLLSTVFGAIL